MRRELSRPEVAFIVRHLLTGCARCLRVTRQVWALGEPESMRRGDRYPCGRR